MISPVEFHILMVAVDEATVSLNQAMESTDASADSFRRTVCMNVRCGIEGKQDRPRWTQAARYYRWANSFMGDNHVRRD